ncbi:MAG TPA: hypothetical protein VGK91_09295 [Candidatus Udaeobacter sp.]
MLLNKFLNEHKAFVEEERKVQKQGATIARLEQQIEALTGGLQKVSAQLELSKPASQMPLNSRKQLPMSQVWKQLYMER